MKKKKIALRQTDGGAYKVFVADCCHDENTGGWDGCAYPGFFWVNEEEKLGDIEPYTISVYIDHTFKDSGEPCCLKGRYTTFLASDFTLTCVVEDLRKPFYASHGNTAVTAVIRKGQRRIAASAELFDQLSWTNLTGEQIDRSGGFMAVVNATKRSGCKETIL